eukprot:XP_013974346.1 synapsin-1-like [Canis lupus familiaris]
MGPAGARAPPTPGPTGRGAGAVGPTWAAGRVCGRSGPGMGSPHAEQVLPWNSFWKPRRLLSANEPGRPVSHRERRQGFPQLVITRRNRPAGPPAPRSRSPESQPSGRAAPAACPPARRHQGALDSGPQVAPLGARWEGFQRGTVTCPRTQDSYHLEPRFCPALPRGPQPPSDPNVMVPWRVTDHRPPPHTHTHKGCLFLFSSLQNMAFGLKPPEPDLREGSWGWKKKLTRGTLYPPPAPPNGGNEVPGAKPGSWRLPYVPSTPHTSAAQLGLWVGTA